MIRGKTELFLHLLIPLILVGAFALSQSPSIAGTKRGHRLDSLYGFYSGGWYGALLSKNLDQFHKSRLSSGNTMTSRRATDSVRFGWLRQYASGLYPSTDEPIDIATDLSGNVYVTGASDSTYSDADYLTIKYDSNGVRQWVRRYNGPDGFDDIPYAIAVDASKNVYVTGTSWTLATGYDYCTIKYDSNGVLQWSSYYNGPGGDIPSKMCLDAGGNVYVTGESVVGTSMQDFLTIKYDPNGIVRWLASYNGPGNDVDVPTGIAVNRRGDVFVTGGSVGVGTDYDYATIKYDSSGTEQWVRRYDGTANSTDVPFKLMLDSASNVYITGESSNNGSGLDYATIKYDSSGNQQWVRTYNGTMNSDDQALGLVLDDSNNVYISGQSIDQGMLHSFTTIKYNIDGVEQWEQHYTGRPNSNNFVSGLANDEMGNIYVTGSSTPSDSSGRTITVKYTRGGDQVWAVENPGNDGSSNGAQAIVYDANGHIYITGNYIDSAAGFDYMTLQYGLDGVIGWNSRYDGPGTSKEWASAFTVNSKGDAIITGESAIADGSVFSTVAYSSLGAEKWAVHYQPYPSTFNTPWSIESDNAGDVIMVGSSEAIGDDTTYTVTTLYDSAGAQRWSVARLGLNYQLAGNVLGVDKDGNVLIATSSFDKADFTTVKYDHEGHQQWEEHYSTSQDSFDGPTALTVDNDVNVYVTGQSTRDFATVKYSPGGSQLWVARYHDSTGQYSFPRAIAVDSFQNVYVTGSSGSISQPDYVTIKYDSNGIQQWIARYNGDGNGADRAYAIAVDDSGNVVVTGRSDGAGTGADFATIKYNSNAVRQWVSRYDGPVHGTDDARGVVIDHSGEIYVSGTSETLSGNFGLATVEYSAAGLLQTPFLVTDAHMTSPGNSIGVKLDNNGNIFSGGTSVEGRWGVTTLVKHESPLTSVVERPTQPARFSLRQNYPNPFNPSTWITYDLPHRTYVRLSVFDLLGRNLQTLVDGVQEAGSKTEVFDARNLSSGIYFYRLETDKFISTKKMVLIR